MPRSLSLIFSRSIIGKPDKIYKMTKPFQVPAEGVVEYQYFKVKTKFKKDKWIQAVEAQANPRAQLGAELEMLFHSAQLNRKFYLVLVDYLSAGGRNRQFRRLRARLSQRASPVARTQEQ